MQATPIRIKGLKSMEIISQKTEKHIAKSNGNGFVIDASTIKEKVRSETFSVSSTIKHAEVFQEILDHLPKDFDFAAEVNCAADEVTVTQKRIITIEQVLKTAIKRNVGLCRHQDFLYGYNGASWLLLDREETIRFLVNAAAKLGVPKYKAKDYKFADELYRQFSRDAYLPAPETDPNTILINLQNYTFEIVAGHRKTREFRRADFLKYQLPFEFNESADCPKWKKFLDEVLPEKDKNGNIIDEGKSKQKVLAEFFAYIFVRKPKLEKALILYGTGENGKSVVFDVVNALLGKENISNFSLESLGENYFRAMIANKLLNYASEISTRLQAEKFKQLTSGEPVEARLPYGQPMTLTNYARLAFNCNELPRDVEHTHAFFRRFLIISFDVTITKEQKDADLADKIIADELPGVFNWILEGLDRLLKQRKFTDCPPAERTLAQFRKESDSVAMFLEDEGYQASQTETRTAKEIFGEYKSYCIDNNYRSLGRNKFMKRLELNGIPRQDSFQPFFCIEKKSFS